MADGDAGLNGAGSGDNGREPIAEEDFLSFLSRYDETESELQSAVAACKEPRKALRLLKEEIADRMPLAAFLRAREDAQKPGHEREEEDRAYRQAMIWFRKPVGTQAAFTFTETGDIGSVEQLQIEKEGYGAGKAGHAEDGNTFSPGTDRWAAWQTAYTRGRTEFMIEQERLAGEMSSTPVAGKRGPGRPRRDGTAAQRRTSTNGAGAAKL